MKEEIISFQFILKLCGSNFKAIESIGEFSKRLLYKTGYITFLFQSYKNTTDFFGYELIGTPLQERVNPPLLIWTRGTERVNPPLLIWTRGTERVNPPYLDKRN